VTEIIFAVLYASIMGLIGCYKTTVFLTFILYINGIKSESGIMSGSCG